MIFLLSSRHTALYTIHVLQRSATIDLRSFVGQL
jgi:hypothetical protein